MTRGIIDGPRDFVRVFREFFMTFNDRAAAGVSMMGVTRFIRSETGLLPGGAPVVWLYYLYSRLSEKC